MLYGLLSTGGVSFTPAKDIPDLTGKVIFITGGNVGLGKESAIQLAKHSPERIYLSCRNAAKADAAIKDIQIAAPNAPITYIKCDLASLESVRNAAKEFIEKETRLDILMLNAGVMALPPGLTKEGYEIQFGTNHVGHALLTKLLLPTLLKTAALPQSDVRIVCVSSLGHMMAPELQFDKLKSETGVASSTWARYAQSKLANILFVKELHRRYGEKNITSVAVHPGMVNTNLYQTAFGSALHPGKLVQKIFYTSAEDGAKGQLWAATGRSGTGTKEVKSGEYYTPVGVAGQGSKMSNDAKLAENLWEWTEKELESYSF